MAQKYIEDIAKMMNESVEAEKEYDEACNKSEKEDEFLENQEFDSTDEEEIDPEDVGITSEEEEDEENESDEFYNEEDEIDLMDEEISPEECGLMDELPEDEFEQLDEYGHQKYDLSSKDGTVSKALKNHIEEWTPQVLQNQQHAAEVIKMWFDEEGVDTPYTQKMLRDIALLPKFKNVMSIIFYLNNVMQSGAGNKMTYGRKEMYEADDRELMSHCLDSFGVKASTANLKAQDTCQWSLMKEEKARRLASKFMEALNEEDFSKLSDDELDKLDKIHDKIENGGEGMSGEDKRLWDIMLKQMGITAKEWNAMSPEEQDQFWNSSTANTSLIDQGHENGFAPPKNPLATYPKGGLDDDEMKEYDFLRHLKGLHDKGLGHARALTDKEEKRLQALIKKGLQAQTGEEWKIWPEDLKDHRRSFTDDNGIIHKIGDYEGSYEGPIPSLFPGYDREASVDNDMNSNAFKRAMKTIREIMAGSQRTEIRQKAMKNARGKDTWSLSDMHEMMRGLTKEERKEFVDAMREEAKEFYGDKIMTAPSGVNYKAADNEILFLNAIFSEMMKDGRQANDSLNNLQNYANSWIDKKGNNPSKVAVMKYMNKIDDIFLKACEDAGMKNFNPKYIKKSIAAFSEAEFKQFIENLKNLLNSGNAGQIDIERNARKAKAKGK